MNPLENCLLLIGLPFSLLLAGYWLASRLTKATPCDRLAVAALAGLVILVGNVAAVGFFQPLRGIWTAACLWPIAATVIDRKARQACAVDVVALWSHPRGLMAMGLIVVFLVLLLLPLLTRPGLVFYDGTSSHDAFFWITAAEHLKRHSYMELPTTGMTRPLMNAVPAIVGWKPLWGRMGAEGLLALVSSVLNVSPVRLYLTATAALVVPWISAVYLAVRTFHLGRLQLTTTASLIVFQPVFVFYFGNANMPNLLGALSGAAAVIALERALVSSADRWVWLVLLSFAAQGILCTYPEILPFVIFPAALLWLRFCFVRGWPTAWRPALFALLATLAGFLANPASTIRAIGGFMVSFDTARANLNWANLFGRLSATQYVPALATLAVPACHGLSPLFGAVFSLILVVGFLLALRRSIDRVGALISIAGSASLLAYTLVTGFNYGWQKTIQYGGAFWVAFVPVAIIDAYVKASPTSRLMRWLSRAGLAGMLVLFGYATAANLLDGYKWSNRKFITDDWFALHDYVNANVRAAPLLIDGASFRDGFFYSMWAAYFLSDNDIYFAARGHENGGYLRDGVKSEVRDPLPKIGAYLVGRDWADAFDIDSPRLVNGDTFVLLRDSNRVLNWDGLVPENGLPKTAATRFALSVIPHAPGTFHITLGPGKRKISNVAWRVTRMVAGLPPLDIHIAPALTWQIDVPLEPGKINTVEFAAEPTSSTDLLGSFVVQHIGITTQK